MFHALFFEGMGEPAAAATDLLDALNSDRSSLAQPPLSCGTMVVVQLLRLTCTVRIIQRASSVPLRSGVFCMQEITGVLPVSRGTLVALLLAYSLT